MRPVFFCHSRTVAAVLSLSAAAAPLAAHAQATDAGNGVDFRIEGSIRARGEALGGQFRPGKPDEVSFVSFRTTVSAEADIGPLTLGGELSDARGYGDETSAAFNTSSVNVLEPLQAYVALDLGSVVGSGEGRLTAGRFVPSIGSGRLVGRPGFPNSVNSFAGAILDWTSARKDRITLLWAKPFDRLPTALDELYDNEFQLDRVAGNRAFFGGSVTRAQALGSIGAEAYVYRLAEHDAPLSATRDRRLVTVGARLLRKPAPSAVDIDIEGALQRGNIRGSSAAADTTDLSVRAGFAHVAAGWTFAGPWKPHLSFEFDYASGEGNEAGRYGRFDPLYGARRGIFGPSSLYGPVSYGNVVSPGVRFEAKPSARIDFFVAARGLWLDSRTDSFGSTGVRDAAGSSGRHAGTQFEGRVRAWAVPQRIRLEGGAAYLAKGAFLTTAPNAPANGDTRYGYLEITFSF